MCFIKTSSLKDPLNMALHLRMFSIKFLSWVCDEFKWMPTGQLLWTFCYCEPLIIIREISNQCVETSQTNKTIKHFLYFLSFIFLLPNKSSIDMLILFSSFSVILTKINAAEFDTPLLLDKLEGSNLHRLGQSCQNHLKEITWENR